MAFSSSHCLVTPHICDDFPPLPPSRQTSISLADGSRHSTPPVPPGFEATQAAHESRRSTPTVPPGLTKPSALPQLDDDGPGSRPTSRPSSRASLRRQVSHQILPALPLRPSTPAARPATPARLASEVREKDDLKAGTVAAEETPTKAPRVAAARQTELSTVVEKSTGVDVKVFDAVSAKPVASEKEGSKLALPATPVKPEPASKPEKENKPTTEVTEARARRKSSGLQGLQPAAKSQATVQTSDAKAAPVTPIKQTDAKKDDAQKRKHPGKLDITAAVSKRDEATAAASKATPVDTSMSGKVLRNASQTPSLATKPESPMSVSSPLVKNAPRTLRVVQTPKTETPPSQPFATPTLPTPGITHKLPSRQPSLASMNVPGTPSSEQISISDNISMTSTSQSRANSPPPPGAGKVGSAPVRAKTKSQMKKDRAERAKAIEEEKVHVEQTANVVAEEPAQEAIISRKKKAKKEKEPKARPARNAIGTADTTPTASRPASPGQQQHQRHVVEEPARTVEPPAPVPKSATPTKMPAQQIFPPPMPSPHEPSPPPTPTLTAAQLLAELKSQAPEIQKCVDSLFRTPTSQQFKPGQNITQKDLRHPEMWKSDFKINLTRDEVDALLKGTLPAVHYGGQEGRIWDRGMVTPTGAHLRALTEELESRFLDLEQALRELPDELRFRPSKPQNEMRFPNMDLEALKRQFENAGGRGVSVMEQMVQDGSTMKKGAFLVDEASKYINEFVMPPVTPPPSNGGGRGVQHQQHATAGAVQSGDGQQPVGLQASPEITERQLHEAKRVADEKENALKKVIKKNKRLLGLG
ncbi:hypothetical protein LTR36_006543 [Oleoguttula mirabilis]|uniref:Uncharacterized protein n=1 Tax=Oleoguttula mirabilis TaxID=1507867 RepID=A0AAV9JWY4_9PEZI|nr:hypothetical protein LTR36_006543 [Oleoguttula mirabilis]